MPLFGNPSELSEAPFVSVSCQVLPQCTQKEHESLVHIQYRIKQGINVSYLGCGLPVWDWRVALLANTAPDSEAVILANIADDPVRGPEAL